MTRHFSGSFTQPDALPLSAIEAAVAELQSGRPHRDKLASDEVGEVAMLEPAFRDWQGSAYYLAMNTGGQAISARWPASQPRSAST